MFPSSLYNTLRSYRLSNMSPLKTLSVMSSGEFPVIESVWVIHTLTSHESNTKKSVQGYIES